MGKAVWCLAVSIFLAGYFFFNNPLARIVNPLSPVEAPTEPAKVYAATDLDQEADWIVTPARVIHDFKSRPKSATKWYANRRIRIVGYVRAIKATPDDVHVSLDASEDGSERVVMVVAKNSTGLDGVRQDQVVVIDGTGDGLALDVPLFRSCVIKAVGFNDVQRAWAKAKELD
jgi:hypothetical protein